MRTILDFFFLGNDELCKNPEDEKSASSINGIDKRRDFADEIFFYAGSAFYPFEVLIKSMLRELRAQDKRPTYIKKVMRRRRIGNSNTYPIGTNIDKATSPKLKTWAQLKEFLGAVHISKIVIY